MLARSAHELLLFARFILFGANSISAPSRCPLNAVWFHWALLGVVGDKFLVDRLNELWEGLTTLGKLNFSHLLCLICLHFPYLVGVFRWRCCLGSILSRVQLLRTNFWQDLLRLAAIALRH